MHRTLDDHQFDAFADESGVRRLGFVEGLSGIWIPPRTELAATEEGKWNVKYPVPERLSRGVENRPESHDLPLALNEAGWKIRKLSDMHSLVEDFVTLSEGPDDDSDVKYFAKKYGPLWVCPKHNHFWSPISPENVDFSNPDPQAFCLWVPREAVRQFRVQARQLKACLEIAQSLAEPRSKAPRTHWERLFGHDLGASIGALAPSQQRDHLAVALAGFILQWVTPWVTWDRDPKPRLTLQTGLGFMGLAWLQAAQLIAGGVDARTCSGCHRFYFRRQRKPPKGCNNFCDECRETEGKKPAKRLWAQQDREKKRQAKAQSSTKKKTGKRKE